MSRRACFHRCLRAAYAASYDEKVAAPRSAAADAPPIFIITAFNTIVYYFALVMMAYRTPSHAEYKNRAKPTLYFIIIHFRRFYEARFTLHNEAVAIARDERL